MKHFFCCALTAVLFLSLSQPSLAAMTKRQKEAHAICSGAYNVRVSACGRLENPNEVDKCLRDSDAKLLRCRKKADKMILQIDPGTTSGSDAPVLSPD